MSQQSQPQPEAPDPRHLSEGERAVRAVVLGAILGVALAVLGRRS